LHLIPCSDAILAGRDIGAVGHVQPGFRSLGTFGGERELEAQVLRRQGGAPGDQVIPVSDLPDVEIKWVRNPGLRRRGWGPGARRYLADPWPQVGGIGPAPGALPSPAGRGTAARSTCARVGAALPCAEPSNSRLPKPPGQRRAADLARRYIKPHNCKRITDSGHQEEWRAALWEDGGTGFS
jgi:hypothetical protein